MAPKTQRNANNTAPHHTSPSRLQNERCQSEQIAKNAGQPKCSKSERARSPDSAAPRGTARGKPAYATGAFPTLAPALVRRRPRRMSIRVKRPSLQPCRRHGKSDDGQDHRRRRAECSVATAGLECSSFASKCVASMACWWGRGPLENTRGAGAAPLQPPTDRSGRTCATAASPRQRSSLEQQRGPSKGPRASSSPAGKEHRVDGVCPAHGILVGLNSLETTVAHSAEYLR